MNRRWWWPAGILAAFLLSGCAEPPTKEMDQASTAVDAARTAGADRYAADGYRAAVDALTRSHTAAAVKDYRLALNHALDSRERARTAERAAIEAKARLQADVERALADVATPLADARARLAAADKARTARRLLRQPEAALASIDADVQKAGEALKGGDYAAAQALLKDVRTRITATTEQIGKIPPPAGARRRR